MASAASRRGCIPVERDLGPLCKDLKNLLRSNGLETIKGVIAFTGKGCSACLIYKLVMLLHRSVVLLGSDEIC